MLSPSHSKRLKALPFWSELTDGQQTMLLQQAAQTHYAKNTQIHGPDSSCQGVLMVLSGQLRVYILSPEGREITLYRVRAGEICVLSASCVLEAITFPVYIDVPVRTDALLIPNAVFHSLANDNVYVRAFGYQQSTKRFSDVLWTMQQILFLRTDQRIAGFLREEARRSPEGRVAITHDALAKHVGSTREVASRMLRYFEQEGLIVQKRGEITVTDIDRLQEYC